MRWLFRPSVLVPILVALVIGAVMVWARFRPESSGPTPLPIEPGDREIVWLYQATSTASWERFVTAIQRIEEQLQGEMPGLKAQIDDRAFPRQSTAVPEVSLTWNGAGGRLVFRWYKLTSEWKAEQWIQALLKNRQPPLAIIGGNSSDNAREVAIHLRMATENLPEEQRPLLLLTTATADVVDWPAETDQPSDLFFQPPDFEGRLPRVSLNAIYPMRTFRFCFNNRQMSEAVAQFIWSRDDLRPKEKRIHMVQWNDDTYSRDLVGGFVQSFLGISHEETPSVLASVAGLMDSGQGNGALLASGPLSTFKEIAFPPKQDIYSSFGPLNAPNRFEVEGVNELLDEAEPNLVFPRELYPNMERPHHLLIVAGQTIPLRRFLRELARTAPGAARRFVIGTGDGLAFNTVYRDRLVTWPIQDLPYPLVFFSHANPVDAGAGFRPHAAGEMGTNTVGDSGATGTEDVLLFAEIIGAVAQGGTSRDGTLANAPRLRERLASARYVDGRIVFGGDDGRLLFGPDGNRASGTGEHVVFLKPLWDGGRGRGRANIEVLTWHDNGTGRTWERRGQLLNVSYGSGEDQPWRHGP